MRIAHVAFNFRLRGERSDRVHHHHVKRAGAHQRIGDFQRLFAGVRLGDVEVVGIDAEFTRVNRVKGVFGVNKGCRAARFLRFGDDLQGQRGFTRRFRAVDFDNPATRQTADAEGNVEAERAG